MIIVDIAQGARSTNSYIDLGCAGCVTQLKSCMIKVDTCVRAVIEKNRMYRVLHDFVGVKYGHQVG